MAATVVDLCVGELVKLKEKVVRPRKLLFSRFQKAEVAEEEEQQEEQIQSSKVISTRNQPSSASSSSFKSQASSAKAADQETTLSEATICLLMDRFAPC